MKGFKLILAAGLLAVSATASAQFSNAGSSSSSSSVTPDGWSTLWLQWNPSTLKIDDDDVDNQSFTGFSVGYSRAFGVSKSIPIFVEPGIGLQYSFHSEDLLDEVESDDYVDEFKQKYNVFSIKVPVNFIYDWQIPNSTVSLMPFVGLNFRYNLSGKRKYDWELTDDAPSRMEDYFEEYYDEDANLFDKGDMGKEYVWKHFQVGWHIGVKARFGKSFLVGASYGSDFSEIAKKCKIAGGNITLGYTF